MSDKSNFSDEAKDINDIKNVYWIDFIPNADGDRASKLTAVQTNMELNAAFLSYKAIAECQQKMAQMSNPVEVSRSSYRAKVLNALTQRTPWIYVTGKLEETKEFRAIKPSFHTDLLNHFTNGLALPDAARSGLESILVPIADAIGKVGGESRMFFYVGVNVFRWDDAWQRYTIYTRTIYFQVDQTLREWVAKKDSMQSDVAVRIDYNQLDTAFNEEAFESNGKDSIQTLVRDGPGLLGERVKISMDV